MVLLEKVLHRVNLTKAMHKVRSNKGSAGIDGIKVSELELFMQEYGQALVD